MLRVCVQALPFGRGLRRPQKMLRRHTPNDSRRRGTHRQNTVPPVHRINPKIKYASQADLITMDLKEFIKIALTDIIETVKETQDEVKGYATIVPFVGMGNKESSVQMKSGIAKISSIDFDVAVSSGTKENGQNDSEARIKVAGIFNIGIGGREGAEKNAQHISRIRFSIPVLLPHSAALEEDVSHNSTTTR